MFEGIRLESLINVKGNGGVTKAEICGRVQFSGLRWVMKKINCTNNGGYRLVGCQF